MYVERLEGWTARDAVVSLGRRSGRAWLDGHADTHEEGRFSFVASDPVEVKRVAAHARDPLAVLSLFEAERDDRDDRANDAGGDDAIAATRVPRWIGYVAYDATWCGRTRTAPRIARDPSACVLWLGRYDAVLVFDEAREEAFVAADDRDAATRLRSRLARGRIDTPRARVGVPEVEPDERHARAIACALEHIARGDIYQVNLARRWRAPYEGDPLALFLAMRAASPVPLGAFVDAGDHAVLARTMERFLSWDRRTRALSSRPIKGTIARAGDDAAEAHALASDDKERAEHAMIVDLMRNDLGRVAEIGSVVVEAPMVVEPYAKLSHLVSTVRCTTRADVTIEDVFRATFPPGSVTGAPKLRAIEIIEALESCPRGVYTGCIGHVDRAGGLHFAVAIRTAQVRAGAVDYHAGGGLVSASVTSREVEETRLKARAFLDAVESLAAEPSDVEDSPPTP